VEILVSVSGRKSTLHVVGHWCCYKSTGWSRTAFN